LAIKELDYKRQKFRDQARTSNRKR